MSDIEDEPPSVLLPCTVCSRTFRPEVLERHTKVCEKTAAKKRRVFDSFKSRVSGTELEEFLGPAPLPGQPLKRPVKSPVKKKVPSRWKETHENLIATLRAARGAEPPEAMIEVSKPAGNEQCPSCNRFFGPRAFDRHVEFCKEKTARIKLTPSKVSQAQERLEARTKYRAPLSIKPKLTTKEKYSPMLPRKESSESCTVSSSSTKASPPVPTLNKNSKSIKNSSSSFSRQTPIRSSERQRSVSPLKKSVISSSKASVKNEIPAKSSNHPKVKENRIPDNLNPKSGTKASTQEKIRSCNNKLTLSEAETLKQLKKLKKKTREKIAPMSNILSDNESIGTIESESERSYNTQRSKWSSLESIKSVTKPHQEGKSASDAEKISLGMTTEKYPPKAKDDCKSSRKNKHHKQVINDLSVNDESFGIFVTPCSMRPPSSSSSRIKISKESSEKPKPRIKKEKRDNTPAVDVKTDESEKKESRESSDRKATQPEVVCTKNEISKIGKEKKPKNVEKASKIPKPKFEPNSIVPNKKEKREPECVQTLPEERVNEIILNKVVPEPKMFSHEDEVKKKSKKWRNIAEISTEELAQMSEDFPPPDQDDEMSSSAIWEIAGEQFLNSEEADQTISAYSLDSLNETEDKKITPDVLLKKKTLVGDDFIVLHAPDPSKMIENDAEMKLSISEPCFPFCEKISKLNTKYPDSTKIDIVVFTAFPNALQPKIIHRKRRKQRKLKQPPPKLSCIREKTFLTQDFPKAKRRRTTLKEIYPPQGFRDYFFGNSSNDFEEKKKKFIQGVQNHWEKIRKWHATSDTHHQFLGCFQKSVEDDLLELRNLFEEKKPPREPRVRQLRREKLKKVKEELENNGRNESPKRGKQFEYFEIRLDDDNPKVPVRDKVTPKLESPVDDNFGGNGEKTKKKFDGYEIPKDDFVIKPKRGKRIIPKEDGSEKVNSFENVEELRERLENDTRGENVSKTVQITSSLNGSLENIEEVDENAEDEKAEECLDTFRKDIEIEDFIVVKPDAKKILSKDGNFLAQLFPKPRKISELIKPIESTTAIPLDYAADSVYDLKSDEPKTPNLLPEMPSRKCAKMLEKRMTNASQLPQILVKESTEKKENSMISLVKIWKHKRESSESDKLYKTKATLPAGKLAPLTNKNTFQMAVLPTILKRQLWEVLKEIIAEGDLNDSYDPFKQAERQMLALLSWPSTADIKTTKDLSASPKPASRQKSNLETSPSSAFTKYPNKNNETKNENTTNPRRNPNDTFDVDETAKKNNRNEKPTYTAADDWEQIFEQHFDLNRNEMTEQMTKSVKSALDGLLKNTIKNKTNLSENISPQKNKTDTSDNSIITDVLFTSTPKHSKSDRTSKTDSTVDLDRTPNTYRKNTNFTYDNRIPPAEDFHDSSGKGKKEDKTNRNSGVSLSSLSFCSQISDTTLADEEVMRSNLEIIGKAAAAATARTPRRKYIRSQSVFDERNKMLFAKTYDPNCSSSDENDVEVLPKIIDKQGNKSPSRNPCPKSIPSHFYRSQSVVEDRFKGDGDHTDDGDHISSPESNRNRKGKLSGDSAYSSLNRRSPRQKVQQNQQEERLSSSGSDHSLPTTGYKVKAKSLDFDSQKKDHPVKMSKFCHECGSKYPVAVAKFCCECGVRRLII